MAVNVKITGGDPSSPLLIYWVSRNNVPINVPILFSQFCPDGTWTVNPDPTVTPSANPPVKLVFRVYTLGAFNQLIWSKDVRFTR